MEVKNDAEGFGPFESLGRALRRLRVERGISQTELAGSTGLTSSMLSKYEHGHSEPTLQTLGKILGGLRVDLYDFADALQIAQGRVRHLPPVRPSEIGSEALECFRLFESEPEKGEALLQVVRLVSEAIQPEMRRRREVKE
ncbi:MAG: helix-turn-helix transcriptional regulator [Acidobacteriota bacterium]